MFEKTIDDMFITVQGVSNGKRLLQTVTMYVQKRKNSQVALTNADITSPGDNAQARTPLSSSESTVSQPTADVNSEYVRKKGPASARLNTGVASPEINAQSEVPQGPSEITVSQPTAAVNPDAAPMADATPTLTTRIGEQFFGEPGEGDTPSFMERARQQRDEAYATERARDNARLYEEQNDKLQFERKELWNTQLNESSWAMKRFWHIYRQKVGKQDLKTF